MIGVALDERSHSGKDKPQIRIHGEMLTAICHPPKGDVTDIVIDESPAPMEVEELPNVHDCE